MFYSVFILSTGLIYQDHVFSHKNVQNMQTNCRSVAAFYHTSNLFADALKDAQVTVMGKDPGNVCALLQDVKTRWNSQLKMVQSFLACKEALLYVLKLPEWEASKHLVKILLLKLDVILVQAGVSLKEKDFDLMEKFMMVLADFGEATEQLSSNSACISEVIPCLYIIASNLGQVSSADQGVMGFKRGLLDSVNTRLGYVEVDEDYTLATMCDPR